MVTVLFDLRATEYAQVGHPERPSRLSRSEAYLRRTHPDWSWATPALATDEQILSVHSAAHLKRLRVPSDFDADTPYYPDIDEHARRSAGAAIAAVELAKQKKQSFSLLRPPGHHACADRAMGFCYLNSIAIAGAHALRSGCARIGIWDFDVHHGNGTESLVQGDPRIRFTSVHQYPGYPGTGFRSFGNVYNWPTAPGTDRHLHASAVRQALDRIMDFEPELILVSAGFDGFREDPLAGMNLEAADFFDFGCWLRETGVPAASILEGGYSDRLPELIECYLAGLLG